MVGREILNALVKKSDSMSTEFDSSVRRFVLWNNRLFRSLLDFGEVKLYEIYLESEKIRTVVNFQNRRRVRTSLFDPKCRSAWLAVTRQAAIRQNSSRHLEYHPP